MNERKERWAGREDKPGSQAEMDALCARWWEEAGSAEEKQAVHEYNQRQARQFASINRWDALFQAEHGRKPSEAERKERWRAVRECDRNGPHAMKLIYQRTKWIYARLREQRAAIVPPVV